MNTIDLRSDTVTRPSKGMLQAMMNARTGDDVFADDPTINYLQEKAATLFGMEAALFCPSGTMTNQIAIKVHTNPGDELIADAASHIYNYEGAGIAFNSGVQAKLLQGDRGRLTAKQIEEAINPTYDWLAKTSLIELENTVNRAGGTFYKMEDIKEIKKVCDKHAINFHLDGARIFNALAETGEKPSDYGVLFDSISICLSKGLGCPVGSLLLGKKDFIAKARRIRKVFGGGMRQAGFLAAAGIYALDNNIERLKTDHLHAKIVGETVSKLSYVDSMLQVDTNIVIFTLNEKLPAADFADKLRNHDIIITPAFSGQTVRFVTHLDITEEMIMKVCEVLKSI